MKNPRLNNILVIDEIPESMVSYHKSEISNMHENKISLSDLWKIFETDKEEIFYYDTSECLTLIDETGNELSLHEYRKIANDILNPKIEFFRISNDELKKSDNDIIVSNINGYEISDVEHKLGDPEDLNCTIPTDFYDMSLAGPTRKATMYDLNGYANTAEIFKDKKAHEKSIIYAHVKCHSVSHKRNGYLYQAYVPALGQMLILGMTYTILEYIKTMVNPSEPYTLEESIKKVTFWNFRWWTSSKVYGTTDCYWTTSLLNTSSEMAIRGYAKYAYACIFPIFKQIKIKTE